MPEHGTMARYRKGCTCKDCAEREKRYRLELSRRPPRCKDLDAPPPKHRAVQEQPMEWMNQALCQGREDLNWVGECDKAEIRYTARTLAKEFCAHCPVRGECLIYGIATKSMGVWGGSYLMWEPRRKVVNLLG